MKFKKCDCAVCKTMNRSINNNWKKIENSIIKCDNNYYQIESSDLELFSEIGDAGIAEIGESKNSKIYITLKGPSGIFMGFVKSISVN